MNQHPPTGADNQVSRIPITLGAELLVEISALKMRIMSFLVGMEHDQYVIVKIAPKDLMGTFRSDVVKNSPITIMYMDANIIYRFQTEILNVVSQPSRLFFLKYPERIEKLGVRNELRHRCSIPAQTMLANDLIDIEIIDLSREGCQCTVMTSGVKSEKLYDLIKVNEIIDIIAGSPSSGSPLTLQGIIRNISKDTDNIKLGVMFRELTPQAITKIDSLLEQTSKTGKQD